LTSNPWRTFHVIEERYGWPLLGSLGIHLFLILFVLFAPFLLPSATPILLGTGPGGGMGGDSYAVGVADDLGGGIGMTKPSLIPRPPARVDEKPAQKEETKAVPLRDLEGTPKKSPREKARAAVEAGKRAADSNVIPTAPQPGAGGTGGLAGGSGGGRGGGVGVSIGSGTGGFGDSWYARSVEARISSNWIRPAPGVQVEIIYSFFIGFDGSIYNLKKEKSSGNEALDLAAERAVRASHPLAPPPPEFRSRPIQFVAQFIFPPAPQ
jgi:TonB family protein